MTGKLAKSAASSALAPQSLKWVGQVRDRLAKHLEHGTTDRILQKVQAGYARDYYLRASRDRVVRAAPTFIVPASLLPHGHVVVDQLSHNGTPVLVHRDAHSGEVRAYVNQCQHRGALLVPPWNRSSGAELELTRPLKGYALSCPYHNWTYDVRNGALRRIPGQQEGFPCINIDSIRLKTLPCQEVCGGIWVGGTHIPEYPDAWSKKNIGYELKDLWLPASPLKATDNGKVAVSARLIGYREWTIKANWQLLVETFLEAYHVKFLHKDTLGMVTKDHHMVVDRMDWKSFRHTVALENFSLSQAPPSDNGFWSTDGFFHQTTTTYFAFPNVAISIFKRFVIFLSIHPTEVQATTASKESQIRAWGISHAHSDEDDDSSVQQRDFARVLKGVEEDWFCAEGIQQGLQPDTEIHHGRFEGINFEFLQGVKELSSVLKS